MPFSNPNAVVVFMHICEVVDFRWLSCVCVFVWGLLITWLPLMMICCEPA
jgi:hypothetical protein